ncbi:hypothetical protein, partial [Saccharothrix sp. Mg75]|uniref:hypothetical protein n=1 Tax=Saccharothrix sp. Mg75 TaxID=3445357 RepID=UPI003EEAE9E0
MTTTITALALAAAGALAAATPASAAAEVPTPLPGGVLSIYVDNVNTTGVIQVRFRRTAVGNVTDRINLGWVSPTGQMHLGPAFVRVEVGQEAVHTWPTWIGPGCSKPVMEVNTDSDPEREYLVDNTKFAC